MDWISLGNSDASFASPRLASDGERQPTGGSGLNSKVLRNGIGGFDSTNRDDCDDSTQPSSPSSKSPSIIILLSVDMFIT